MLRARPANGDPNVVAVPEIVGTPVCVVAHGGGLSEVDGVDDAEELEDGGVSGPKAVPSSRPSSARSIGVMSKVRRFGGSMIFGRAPKSKNCLP